MLTCSELSAGMRPLGPAEPGMPGLALTRAIGGRADFYS